MPGKTTVACSHEQYETLINLIFLGNGKKYQAKPPDRNRIRDTGEHRIEDRRYSVAAPLLHHS